MQLSIGAVELVFSSSLRQWSWVCCRTHSESRPPCAVPPAVHKPFLCSFSPQWKPSSRLYPETALVKKSPSPLASGAVAWLWRPKSSVFAAAGWPLSIAAGGIPWTPRGAHVVPADQRAIKRGDTSLRDRQQKHAEWLFAFCIEALNDLRVDEAWLDDYLTRLASSDKFSALVLKDINDNVNQSASRAE